MIYIQLYFLQLRVLRLSSGRGRPAIFIDGGDKYDDSDEQDASSNNNIFINDYSDEQDASLNNNIFIDDYSDEPDASSNNNIFIDVYSDEQDAQVQTIAHFYNFWKWTFSQESMHESG